MPQKKLPSLADIKNMLVRTDFRTFRPKTINGAHVRAKTCHVECAERNVLGAWFYHAGHVYVTDYRFPHWARTLIRKKNKQPPVRVSGVRNDLAGFQTDCVIQVPGTASHTYPSTRGKCRREYFVVATVGNPG